MNQILFSTLVIIFSFSSGILAGVTSRPNTERQEVEETNGTNSTILEI